MSPTARAPFPVSNVSFVGASGYYPQFISLSDTDTITLSPELVIKGQSIGVASTAKGFNDVDGILGIGPTGLTQGTVSSNKLVPTVTDNLFSQGTIATECIGICYAPTGKNGEINGELTFGGVDDSKYMIRSVV